MTGSYRHARGRADLERAAAELSARAAADVAALLADRCWLTRVVQLAAEAGAGAQPAAAGLVPVIAPSAGADDRRDLRRNERTHGAVPSPVRDRRRV